MRQGLTNKKSFSLALTLIVTAGLFLSGLLYIVADRWERKRIEAEFAARSNDCAARFQSQMSDNFEKLESLASLYSWHKNNDSHELNRSEFRNTVESLFIGNSSAQAFEWIPRVKDDQRTAYETAAQKDGFANFHFTERDSSSQLQIAGKRSEYFPVYYVEPYKGNEAALGFDLASNSKRRDALIKSQDTGQMVATARVTLVQEKAGQFGFLVFKPVYENPAANGTPEQSGKNLRGFMLGVFRIGDIFEKSHKSEKPPGIDFYIFDESAPLAERFLYFHPSRTRTGPFEPFAYDDAINSAGLKNLIPINVGGRKWMIAARPAPAFFAASRTWQPLQILLTGFLVTGLVAGYVTVMQNRSAKLRRMNADLLQTKEMMEEEISERKRVGEMLQTANQQLEEHNKLKSELIDTVSHELRTPLCIFENVISNALAGTMGEVPEKLKENLIMADKEINRLGHIISNFVDVSAIDQGKMQLLKKQFSIQAAVNKAIGSLTSYADSKSIRLSVDAPRNELFVEADYKRMVQVLSGLIDNAIKFTPDGGGVSVCVKDLEDEVIVRVDDNGTGLSADEISRAFNRFVQIEKMIGPGHHGTGLGLSIAKSIIEMHDGRIWAESMPGQGSSFCFALPKSKIGAQKNEATCQAVRS